MKVSSLLAQYLYDHKRLDLPGIGRFHIDDTVEVPEKEDRNFPEFLQYIQFTSVKIYEAESSLIEYIRQKTGKIPPLAIADLETFISQGKELLNISKPFPIEGIGVLQQIREGQLQFTPGDTAMAESPGEKKQEKSHAKSPVYDSEFTKPAPKGNSLLTVFIILGILLGVGAIIGGGYYLYNRNMSHRQQAQEAMPSSTPDSARVIAADSSVPSTATDTLSLRNAPVAENTAATAPVAAEAGEYKFVFETTHKRRAIPRFAQVHELSPRIQMETSDSVNFRIFVILPSRAADTAWKKDSLKAWYWGTRPYGVRIEK